MALGAGPPGRRASTDDAGGRRGAPERLHDRAPFDERGLRAADLVRLARGDFFSEFAQLGERSGHVFE